MRERVCKVLFCLTLLIFGALRPFYASAQETVNISQNPNVLILSSYSYEWESIPKQLDGITDTLNGYAKTDYVFMHTKRLKYEEVKEHVYSYLLNRIEKEPYDYVIAGDDAALQFVMEYRDELFSGIPIIFEGINNEASAAEAAQNSLITGIVETFPLKETIQLALAVHPKAVRVVAITDDSVSGKGSTRQFMDCRTSFSGLEFSTINTSKLTFREIGTALSECREDTILIFLMMTEDADGNQYTNTEAAEYVTACADIPVYKADELGIGNGILGGVVVSYYAMGADAAAMVLAVEQGSDIEEIKVQKTGTYCSFDKEVMDRYHITKKELSSVYDGEIQYINDELSFFQKHRSVLLPSCLIIILLMVFSAFCFLVLRSKKKVVKQLEDKNLQLDSLLDNLPGGLAVFRLASANVEQIDMMYCSEGIAKLTGYTMEEFIQLTKNNFFKTAVPKNEVSQVLHNIEDNINSKKTVYQHYHLLHKDGTTVWVSMAAVWGYTDKDGKSIYYTVIMDSTEQEKIQKAEQKALKAKLSNEAKSDFLSRMSHDIRTPLNAVLGFALLAQNEPDVPKKVRDYLDKINVSGKYLIGLVNDILDMSKIESGKLELREKSVHWQRFLNGIAEIFRAQAQEKNIELVTDFSLGETTWIFMDELRMRQIYSNLLSNAVKFSGDGTRILWTLHAAATASGMIHMTCSISDQGRGMSEKFIKKMFDPFEQESQDADAVGTGLGLTIVKSLVSLMGGTIRVESKVSEGTTFIIELDRKPGEVQETETSLSVLPDEVIADCQILLCEDNQINSLVVRKLLEKKGCTLTIAENGQRGVELFSASAPGQYAAILMDIRMPVMNGLEAARAIRALNRTDADSVPIIAMSANAFAEDVQKSLDAGMNAHLSKPVDAQMMYETLAAHIAR